MSRAFRMLVNGKLVPGQSGTFQVINPSTGKPFAECPQCSKAQLDEAVLAAQAAFPSWAATDPKKRKDMMMAGAGKVQQSLNSLAEVLVREQGKPLNNAKGEIMGIIGYMQYFGNTDYEFEKVIVDTAKERVLQRRTPLGVVGGITPWNFPPLMGAWKMAEALMTGNTMVLKPSPYTPLSTLMLGEILADSFPPGVFNVVSGGDELGRWMTEHEGIAKISFTGSTRTGKAIQASSSGTLKRLTLELGGNDAAIVLDDADPKAAATGVFNQAMGNSGQICIAIKRLFVHESKFDAVVNELTTLAKKAKVGDGFKDGVAYGPINNKMQFDRVSELVEDAKKQGAKVHAGGQPLQGEGDGYFYPPTILTGVKEGTRVVDEEQFGPVLPVMPYSDVADAVRRTNATAYGLGGSVWGSDVEKAAEVAAQIQSGTVWVNGHGMLTPDVPFGGMKESGIGRQMGEGTLEGYTDTKVIRIPKSKM
eukprot:CAMPEP_0197909118 /NCGR_PEP_ID=MMETSP1439-20131203/68250_1 /TAXON_ID=66791 /ORGANISM="Gonyaulax spinifera, Strain CCMP409" /LENGTH=476 /DNA_ID=CAMNT_0043530667 /DNA_START=64 /DNA_END=1494 /DNA_ORIENTATION=-